MTQPAEEHYKYLDDADLAAGIDHYQRMEASARNLRQRAETELQRRLEARGATELAHPALEVRLVAESPKYDPGKLQGLYEVADPTEVSVAWEPPHEKTVEVAGRWNGTKLNTLARKYGDPVRQVLEAARLPGVVRLVVKPKEPTKTLGQTHAARLVEGAAHD